MKNLKIRELNLEIKELNCDIDIAKDLIRISSSGIDFSFLHTGEGLSVNAMLPSRFASDWVAPVDGSEYCSEVEMLVTGDGRDFAARSRCLGGSGRKLKYIKTQRIESAGGVLCRNEYFRQDKGLKVFSNYFFPDKAVSTVRRWVDVVNVSKENIGLEYVASSVLYHIAQQGCGVENIRVYLPYSSWSAEAQWKCLSLEQLGVIGTDSSHYRAKCLGSRSSAEYSPMAIIYDNENDISYFFQIEHSSSWMWEIGKLFIRSQHGLYLIAGGPDEENGHWWKPLAPGESFSSVPVSIGCVRGGFESAVEELTKYRRIACKKKHIADDKLPVIFNDYMNCLWGNPTVAAELPKIEAAAEMGCEYYVMDSGWYAKPGEHWWPGVGHWQPNEQRFGKGGFMRIMDYIRKHGMKPGLWIEAEVVGIHNSLANKPDNWFLSRHKQRIIYNSRYFLNLRNPEVIEYLDSVIDKFVNEYGVCYIKNDYNIDLLQGTDTQASSFGDGLLEHTRAFYMWIDKVHARHPHLIWENCAAGGLRTDYGVLSRAQIQSSSDLEDFSQYSALSIGCSATVLPEQMAVWSYPTEPDNQEHTIYNMVNSLLFRIHLSGKIDTLSNSCKKLVREAVDYYKSNREVIPLSYPIYPLGIPGVNDDKCWMAIGMKNGSRIRLALWRKNADADSCFVPLRDYGKIKDVRCVYPREACYKPNFTLDNGGITVEYNSKLTARLFDISFY